MKRRLAGLPARRPLRTEGTITDLRSILGLGDQIRQPYTLLAMDTEFVNPPVLLGLPILILVVDLSSTPVTNSSLKSDSQL